MNILKREEFYNPEVKRFKDLEMKYFINSTIIKKNLIIYLGNDSHINDIFKHSKISYVIANKKVIILNGFIINIGIFDSNNIFNSEILIRCTGEQTLNSTLNELKANNNENLLSQVNILKNNIGKYKGNNTVVFINENYIPKTQIDENKNKLIDNNQQEQKKNGEGHYKKNSNISNHQNNIVKSRKSKLYQFSKFNQ